MPFYDVIAVEVIAEADANLDIPTDDISGLEGTTITVSYTYLAGRPRATAFVGTFHQTFVGADHADAGDTTVPLGPTTTPVGPTDLAFSPTAPMDADGTQNGSASFTAQIVTATVSMFLRLAITQP